MAIDYKAALREIVEKLGDFAADRRALITILNEAGVTWEARLDDLRETPEYKAIALRYQILLKQLEVDDSFEDLARLMQELNEGKPQN